jgi:2,3-dihydroxybenzoate-AMP ligase
MASTTAGAPRATPFGGHPDDVRARWRALGVWGTQSIGDRFRSAARSFADRTAIVAGPMRLSYAELDSRSDAFGAGLLRQGHVPGERVLFQVGNIGEAIVAYYGVLKAGLIPVCSLAQHRERDIGALAELTDAGAIVVQADYRTYDLVGSARVLRDRYPAVRTIVAIHETPAGDVVRYDALVADGARHLAELDAVSPDPEEIAVMQLSGGTTATPKVIGRLHADYIYNAEMWASFWKWDSASVVMHALPLMHNACLAAAMHPAHAAGATFVLAANAEASTIFAAIESEGVTAIPVVPPAVLVRLLEAPDLSSRDLSSVRHFVIGGQKLPVEFADELEAKLGIRCHQMFGMAEGLFIATPATAPESVRKRTVGVPASAYDEIRILEPGTETPVPLGEIGELCARGPYTIREYYGAPQHNAVAFTSEGFYRTGDLARAQREADGSVVYSIEGRIKDVINRGLEKINAEEIEELLIEHPAIAQVALVSMPDRELGERVCAFVILQPDAEGLTVADCVTFLLERGVTKFKLPERVEIVSTFPLTNIGKVSKRDLREQIVTILAREQASLLEEA